MNLFMGEKTQRQKLKYKAKGKKISDKLQVTQNQKPMNSFMGEMTPRQKQKEKCIRNLNPT